MSDWFVVGMGIGIVFLGLICIVILCKILSFFCNIGKKAEVEKETKIPQVSVPQVIENRQEIIAAVSAAIAEEMGTDVSAIRILSFKKI